MSLLKGFGKMKKRDSNGASLGFEEVLWKAADKLRNNMDAAEYKHIVLGMIFLKYISDAFDERRKKLEIEVANPKSEYYIKEPSARYEAIEDRDEYKSLNIFYVPEKARWQYLQKNAKQPTIGKIIDDAMDRIEKENPILKGILHKDYANPKLDKQRLGELIDLIGTIGLGDYENRSKDILGRVYEYFLGQFADSEGKRGGQFYTPRSIVKLLVEMMEPYKGRIFDPCCGSGGMFVQSEKFVKAHDGRLGDIAINGQESNQTTYKLCKMNLAIRGIDSNIRWNNEGSFLNDAHKDLKADFIMANPPFNDSDWKGEQLREDARWKFGVPPPGNANFAWVQHFIHHLSPNGIAGFVLANGSMSSNQSNEGEIRKNIIDTDIIDCMVSLPPQLFYNVTIPACLWFIARDKKNHKFRDRRGFVLFIDARKMGVMLDRRHRELAEAEIVKISAVYHSWRGEGGKYKDIKGFCKSAKLEDIKQQGYILTPGRYVGTEEIEEDKEKFEEKMKRLTVDLKKQFKKSHELESNIKKNLKGIGYEI